MRADMVGHTGDLQATIVACTAVDKCVKVLLTPWLQLRATPLFGSCEVIAWAGSCEPSVSAWLGGRSCWTRWKQWVGAGWSLPITATPRTWCACVETHIVHLTQHILAPLPTRLAGPFAWRQPAGLCCTTPSTADVVLNVALFLNQVQRDKKTGAPLREEDGRPRPLSAHTLNPVRLAAASALGW